MRCTPSSASWRRGIDRLLALWKLPAGLALQRCLGCKPDHRGLLPIYALSTAGAYLLECCPAVDCLRCYLQSGRKLLAQMEKISASAATTPRPISPRSSAAKTDSDRSPSNIFTQTKRRAASYARPFIHWQQAMVTAAGGWRKPCQNRSERRLSPPSIFLYSEVSHVRVLIARRLHRLQLP